VATDSKKKSDLFLFFKSLVIKHLELAAAGRYNSLIINILHKIKKLKIFLALLYRTWHIKV